MVMGEDSRPRGMWVRIPVPDSGWTFFTYIGVKIVMFV